MGLSASQARLLNLTGRMHDIEYKAQNLEAQKLEMANESTAVYQDYEDALNKQKVQLKSVGSDGTATYKDITGTDLKSAGYAFEVATGQYSGKVYSTIADAAKAASGTALTADATGGTDGTTNTITNLIEAGFVVLVKLPQQSTGGYPDITTLTGYSATVGIPIDTVKTTYSNTNETNIATDTNLQETSDETLLKKAEAKYEASMAKIDAKDKKFDTDIASLDNERTAIKTEIDTLKTVAKDNIDRTFKLFS